VNTQTTLRARRLVNMLSSVDMKDKSMNLKVQHDDEWAICNAKQSSYEVIMYLKLVNVRTLDKAQYYFITLL